jgi:protein-disulfide isomerase
LKSITNSLKKASKQFPKGEPAVVIVKVPAHWIRDVAVQRGIVSTAKEFLRDKERIVSIKFYATVPIVTNLYAVNTHIYSEVSNPNGLFPTRNWDMFKRLSASQYGNRDAVMVDTFLSAAKRESVTMNDYPKQGRQQSKSPPPQRAGRASAHQRGRNGYEPTREAAMAAFAKSWRRE